MQGWNLKMVVSRCTLAMHLVEASSPQGSILDPILWNVYFNNVLKNLLLVLVYIDKDTLSHSYGREKAVNDMSPTTNLVTLWLGGNAGKSSLLVKRSKLLLSHVHEKMLG